MEKWLEERLYFPHELQGETFDVPEVVPFRLTHNMVHGMVRTFLALFQSSSSVSITLGHMGYCN